MKVWDTVHKMELDIEEFELYRYLQEGRQVDLHLGKVMTDADGYIQWDVEHWTSIARAYMDRGLTLEQALQKVPKKYREAVREALVNE